MAQNANKKRKGCCVVFYTTALKLSLFYDCGSLRKTHKNKKQRGRVMNKKKASITLMNG